MFVTMYQSYAFALTNKTSHAYYHCGLLIIGLISMITSLWSSKNWLSRFTFTWISPGTRLSLGISGYDHWHKVWGEIPFLFLWRHWNVGYQQQNFEMCNKYVQEMYCRTGLVHERRFFAWCFHFLHLVQAKLRSNSWCFPFLKQFYFFSKQHNENPGFRQNFQALFEIMVMNFRV